jgi:hypothetical protein
MIDVVIPDEMVDAVVRASWRRLEQESRQRLAARRFMTSA